MSATLEETVGFQPPYVGKRRRRGKQFAEGIIRVRRIPDSWTEDEFRYWWCPETDGQGHLIRPARISEREKSKLTLVEVPNQIMIAGRTQVLTYIGSSTGNTTGWAKYLAIGTGAIQTTNPNDTQLATEVFRKAQASFTVQGTQVDINFQLASGDAQVQMTNCGLYGNTATSTLGSGTLMTHALFAFSKGSYSIAIDYLINLL